MQTTPHENPAITIANEHNDNPEHWAAYQGTHDPRAAKLQSEREAARAEAARREAELAARQAALDAERAAWLAVLSKGQAAQACVRLARQQVEILAHRLAAVEAAFDKSIGGLDFSADFCAATGIDPLAPRNACFMSTGGIYPLEFMGGQIVALETALSRARKILVIHEADETAALAEARDYAKAHNLQHDFGDEPAPAPTLPPASVDADSVPAASPFVEMDSQPTAETKGRRKATK